MSDNPPMEYSNRKRAVTKCLHTLSQPSFVFYFVSFASVSFLAGSSLAVSSGAFPFASLVAMPFFLAASNVSVPALFPLRRW